MKNKIDHIAIGTGSLEAGADALQITTGVAPSVCSNHDLTSTYNRVMQAGNESFFELKSIDPDAPEPSRVRWTGNTGLN